jgi:methionyl-tRNA formyltransferase
MAKLMPNTNTHSDNMKKEDLKIVFMGTPEFAVPSLDILLKNGYNVPAVVTVPDKPKGRGLKLEPSDIKKFALANHIPILQPEKMRDETFLNELEKISPDIIVVVAFRILPREVYTKAKLGAFNLHASLLPKYRGAAPINWAIMNGDNKTGITTFFLEDKVDTGNMIYQEEIEINENDSAGDVHDKLSLLGSSLVLKTVDVIFGGNSPHIQQNNTESSPAPKIFKEHCKINWNKSAEQIHNQIRGLSPYPAAYTGYNDKIVKIYKTIKTDIKSNKKPGSITASKKELYINCSDYILSVLELQLEGKRKLKTEEFLRGFVFSEDAFFDTSL